MNSTSSWTHSHPTPLPPPASTVSEAQEPQPGLHAHQQPKLSPSPTKNGRWLIASAEISSRTTICLNASVDTTSPLQKLYLLTFTPASNTNAHPSINAMTELTTRCLLFAEKQALAPHSSHEIPLKMTVECLMADNGLREASTTPMSPVDTPSQQHPLGTPKGSAAYWTSRC